MSETKTSSEASSDASRESEQRDTTPAPQAQCGEPAMHCGHPAAMVAARAPRAKRDDEGAK